MLPALERALVQCVRRRVRDLACDDARGWPTLSENGLSPVYHGIDAVFRAEFYRCHIDVNRCHIDVNRCFGDDNRCHIDVRRCFGDDNRCPIDVTSMSIDDFWTQSEVKNRFWRQTLVLSS